MLLSELYAGRVVQRPAEVVFEEQWDVIVSGLGNSGTLAALFCAENGLSVLGVESFTGVGGSTTFGGVTVHYFGCPGGRADAVEAACRAHSERTGWDPAESGRFVLEEKLLQNGVALLYESSVCGVWLDGNKVAGVRVITPEGIRDIGARILMDCTGDGCVAQIAGCSFEGFGRAWDGQGQPYSRMCRVRQNGKELWANLDFGRVDPRDDRALSDAMLFSGGYEHCVLQKLGPVVQRAPLIGLREGRHIRAEETMYVEDVFAGKRTDQPAFYSYSDLDKHGWDKALEGTTLADWSVGANLNAYTMSLAVPWKSILPQGMDGLLVPCRALGVDRDVAASVRMIPDMNKLAEIAADVALLAIRHGCPTVQIPYPELRARLQASGCLDEAHDKGVWVDGARDCDGGPLTPEKVVFPTAPEQLELRLATLQPGVAIRAARGMDAAAAAVLCGLLDSPDENTRKHAAFALAARGDARSLPLLRQMLLQRDAVMLRDCRKYNQHRGPMAIYWLGRLADVESIAPLLELLTDPQEHRRAIYAPDPRYPWKDFRVLHFMFACGAVAALVRIGDAHPAHRARIAASFEAAFGDGTYYAKLTDRPVMSCEGGMVQNLSRVAAAAAARWKSEQA